MKAADLIKEVRSSTQLLIETRLSKNSFPSECEFTVDELLNVDFIDNFIDEYASKSTNPYFDYTKWGVFIWVIKLEDTMMKLAF